MKPKFKDVAKFYVGTCEMVMNTNHWFHPEGDKKVVLLGVLDSGDYLSYQYVDQLNTTGNDISERFKPILKPMSEITEEDFREFATSELLGANEKMAFDFSDGDNWRACSYNYDPDEVEWDDAQRISDCEEDDPFGVLMMNTKRGDITHGWIELDETYCPVNISITAKWIAFLCSKSYNVFNLPESEIATI